MQAQALGIHDQRHSELEQASKLAPSAFAVVSHHRNNFLLSFPNLLFLRLFLGSFGVLGDFEGARIASLFHPTHTMRSRVSGPMYLKVMPAFPPASKYSRTIGYRRVRMFTVPSTLRMP